MRSLSSAMDVDKWLDMSLPQVSRPTVFLRNVKIVNKARPCKVGTFMSVTNKVSEDMENQISTDKHIERHYLGFVRKPMLFLMVEVVFCHVTVQL